MVDTYQNKNSPYYTDLPFMEIEGTKQTIEYPCSAEIKFDGEFQYLIRSGKEIVLANKREHGRIRKDLPATQIDIPDNSVFLAELIYQDGKDFYSFARHKLDSDLNLAVFGCVKFCGIDFQKTTKPDGTLFNYTDIRTLLEKQTFYNSRVCLTPRFVVNNEAELTTVFNRVVALGFEGLVIKSHSSVYSNGATYKWCKWKHIDDIDVAIIGFQTGTKKAKNLSVRVAYQKDGKLVSLTHVGGGFELAEKLSLLPLLQADVIGRDGDDYMVTPKYVITVTHNGLIRNADGSVNSLRHPRFKCLRPDKTVSQVDTV